MILLGEHVLVFSLYCHHNYNISECGLCSVPFSVDEQNKNNPYFQKGQVAGGEALHGFSDPLA